MIYFRYFLHSSVSLVVNKIAKKTRQIFSFLLKIWSILFFLITVDNQVIDSFESWLEVHLENCILSFDAEDIPKVEVIDGLNALHAHADEAARQFSVTQELTGVKDIKEVLDLIVALWWVLKIGSCINPQNYSS